MIDKLKLHLKNHGYSITPPRLAVFRYLQEHDTTTAGALIEALCSEADQASVYRTIALYKETGVVRDLILSGQKRLELTDSFDSHHHHISCLRCGKSVTIEDSALERRLEVLAMSRGIRPVSHQIEVSGICQDCESLAY